MNGKRNRGANIINVINECRGELQCTFFFSTQGNYITGYEQ